ncbi:unnamed protein product [Linum tenue]|uniref:Protein kinase domain-containing protein n=4 Tax=Linum tenue TaxID=586396 RepID=A0AAV0P485_9ROSI|nr:unnamed protein product [Linum tenue]
MLATFLFLLTTIPFLLPSITPAAAAGGDHQLSAASTCVTTCGATHLNYPFGFSPGCHVRLTCSPAGQPFIGEFPVSAVDNSTIRININPTCGRPIAVLQSLFTKNYAPKSSNAILLHNCTDVWTCNIPTIDVQTHFEPVNSVNCSGRPGGTNGSLSCFSDSLTWNGLFDYANMTRHTDCEYLMSSISVEYAVAGDHTSGVSLEVQMMELEWWMDGRRCATCSEDAECRVVNTTDWRRPGYRCGCRRGFSGDGYRDGVGCRKDSCRSSEYLLGYCRPIGIAILTGGFGAATALILGLAFACCFIRRRSASNAESSTKRRLAEAKGINITIYQYKEIERATNGFSDTQRLGTGAYGTVYSGKLHHRGGSDSSLVAIKRIKNRDTESIEQVLNEIKLISSVSHPNLVRLLGCSIERGEQILVYEFMPNGTLSQHLQRERGDGPLSWPVRLAIALETAQAIAHLHSAIDPPIYHRDIKTSNILLDLDFKSKVADFGLSRLGKPGMPEISHISTAPQGTPGYLDPQYHQNFHLSDKSDVYSFGVVLVEIITAMKAVDFSRPSSEVNLANLAADRIGSGRLDEIVDPFLDLNSDAWTLSSIHRVAEIAFRCLAYDRELRPGMIEVAAELEQIRDCRSAESRKSHGDSSGGGLGSEISPCCSSSSTNDSEKPLSLSFDKGEMRSDCLVVVRTETDCVKAAERSVKEYSPVSVRDPWLSEQSSPGSNSFQNGGGGVAR